MPTETPTPSYPDDHAFSKRYQSRVFERWTEDQKRIGGRPKHTPAAHHHITISERSVLVPATTASGTGLVPLHVQGAAAAQRTRSGVIRKPSAL